MYIVVLHSDPYIVLFNRGYARKTSEEFVYTGEKPKRTYLTNNFSQRKHPNYEEIKEELTISQQDFNGYVKSVNNWTDEEVEENIWSKIKNKLKDVFLAVKKKIDKKKGLFEILGADFMLTEDLKQVYLIEVNTNPAYFTNTKV